MTPQASILPTDALFYVLLDVAIILLAAQIVGRLFAAVGQPRVVGEIIAGILLGPTLLGGSLGALATPSAPAVEGTGIVGVLFPPPAASFLNLTGQIGLIFYMFLVGMQLDQSLLKGRGRQIMLVALAVVAVPLAMGFLVGALLTGPTWIPEGVNPVAFSLLVGAAISVTAFPVMARILEEKGMISTSLGATGVGAAAVVTVLMFLAIAAANASARNAGIIDQVGLRFVLTIVLIGVLFVAVRPVLERVTSGVDAEGKGLTTTLGILLALALAVGLLADRIGISALVGGFLFGLVVPKRLAGASIRRMETAVTLFFLPIFLAFSGLRTDLKLLTPDLFLGLFLVLALMIIGKWAVGYLAGRATGLPSYQAHVLGVLLNCRGLLILVVALQGLQLGVITPQMQAVFVIGAIVTTVMTGPLVDYFLKKQPSEPQEPHLAPDDAVPVAAIAR
ncbi:MAG: cation:proton antiporter [Chloroflexi bacterium]|nr:cation:proton antiporter [Chloroflexota bacterium]